MKKILIITILFIGVVSFAGAQSAEEQGKAIWNQLQAKEITCANLNDSQYEFLGEYFMGQMMGSNHEAMDQWIETNYGIDNLRQMHIGMGKRFSGCDLNAALPFNMPMGWMMQGGWSNPQNYGFNNMMYNMMGPYGWGYGSGFGWLSLIFMVLWWVFVVAVIVLLIRAIFGIGRKRDWNRWAGGEKGPLEILKERYAKGEIDKNEYDDKKKDLER